MENLKEPNIKGKTDEEIINLYSNFLIEYGKSELNYRNDLVNEEIEDLYFEILKTYKNNNPVNDDCFFGVESELEYKRLNYLIKKEVADKISVNIKNIKERLNKLDEIRSKSGLYGICFYYRNTGYPPSKNLKSYKIFIEFKRKYFNNIGQGVNPKRLSAPVIIAVLNELKVFGEFNRRGFGREAVVETLFQIIGTNKKNLGRYYDDLKKNGVNKEHLKKAKDFLNSKGY